MFETVTRHDFIDRFRQSDTYKNNFSYEGLNALFDHLEEIEDYPTKFDYVAIACEFSEYDSEQAAYADYLDILSRGEKLEDHTTVIKIDCGLTDSKFHNCSDHGEVIIRSF